MVSVNTVSDRQIFLHQVAGIGIQGFNKYDREAGVIAIIPGIDPIPVDAAVSGHQRRTLMLNLQPFYMGVALAHLIGEAADRFRIIRTGT